MTDDRPTFDLDALQDGVYLAQLVGQRFRCPVTQLHKIGQGFYAVVYLLSIPRPPRRVIVKCHRFPGFCARERTQLELLSRHALVKVPEVYHLHRHTPRLPFDALVMEFIPGISASKVAFPDPRTQARFVDSVIDNLLAWHAVRHDAGFGEIGGPFYPTWLEFFQERVSGYHQRVHAPRHRATVSEYVMSVIDWSFQAVPLLFAHARPEPSLVHGDYNLWNVMVNPETYEVSGIIDPIDAGWGDAEIDLFHLPNCRPELGLLARYLQHVEVDDAFQARFALYRFWDDVKHFLRVGWYEEGRFSRYAQALEQEMNRR